MIANVFVDDQSVAVIRHDRCHHGPAEVDAAAVELIRAQRYFGAGGVRLQRGQRALWRRHVVLAAADQLGQRQVPQQTVLQRWRRRAHGRLAGRAHRRTVIGQPRGEVQKAAVAVQWVVCGKIKDRKLVGDEVEYGATVYGEVVVNSGRLGAGQTRILV